MRKIRVEDAIGQTLCHDMTAILEDGFKGVKFKRGRVITSEDVPELKNIGKDHIFVWEPEADEVHEEDAAVALCDALCGENIEKSAPSEGKITITASADGLLCINSPALRSINSVPDYTVACLPNYMPVTAGQKLAGARIVPLVTKRENVEKAVEIFFRVNNVYKDVVITVTDGEKELVRFKREHMAPGEMEKISISKALLEDVSGELTVAVVKE